MQPIPKLWNPKPSVSKPQARAPHFKPGALKLKFGPSRNESRRGPATRAALMVVVGVLAGLLSGRAIYGWQMMTVHAAPVSGDTVASVPAAVATTAPTLVAAVPILPTPTAVAPTPTAAVATPTMVAPSLIISAPTVIPRPPQDSPSLIKDADAGLAGMAQRVGQPPKRGPFTIAVAAVDLSGAPTGSANAGAFVVGQIDPERNTSTWVALPADLQVQIPGNPAGRLDSVLAIGERLVAGGGPPFLKQALEQNLGVPVNFYLIVDRDGLAQGIDASDMLSVTVPYSLGEAGPTDALNAPAALRSGSQLLDGMSFFEYLRSRDRASDAEHMGKLRAVAEALMQKARQPGSLEQAVFQLVEQLPHYRANLGPNQILGLVMHLRKLTAQNLVLRQVDSTMIDSNGPRWDRIRSLFADWKR